MAGTTSSVSIGVRHWAVLMIEHRDHTVIALDFHCRYSTCRCGIDAICLRGDDRLSFHQFGHAGLYAFFSGSESHIKQVAASFALCTASSSARSCSLCTTLPVYFRACSGISRFGPGRLRYLGGYLTQLLAINAGDIRKPRTGNGLGAILRIIASLVQSFLITPDHLDTDLLGSRLCSAEGNLLSHVGNQPRRLRPTVDADHLGNAGD